MMGNFFYLRADVQAGRGTCHVQPGKNTRARMLLYFGQKECLTLHEIRSVPAETCGAKGA